MFLTRPLLSFHPRLTFPSNYDSVGTNPLHSPFEQIHLRDDNTTSPIIFRKCRTTKEGRGNVNHTSHPEMIGYANQTTHTALEHLRPMNIIILVHPLPLVLALVNVLLLAFAFIRLLVTVIISLPEPAILRPLVTVLYHLRVYALLVRQRKLALFTSSNLPERKKIESSTIL